MAETRAPEGAEIRTDAGGQLHVGIGSIVQPLYMERRMKCYVVTDGDLSHISLANWLITGATSFGAFCLSQGLAIHLNAAFAAEMAKDAKILLSIVAPLAFILALLSFGASAGAYFWRRNHLEIIKRESVERQGSAPAQ